METRGEEGDAKTIGGADAHRAFGGAIRASEAARGEAGALHGLGMDQEFLAIGGQLGALRMATEEDAAEVGLKSREAPGDGRVIEAEGFEAARIWPWRTTERKMRTSSQFIDYTFCTTDAAFSGVDVR